MPATLQSSAPASAKSPHARPVRTRPRLTLEELLRRAAESVERGPTKLITGTFRRTRNGRPLTRSEKGMMILLAVGLSLAIWFHSRPEPVSAHAIYYRSLAATTPLDASVPRTFAESALQAIGADWHVERFFTCVAPVFWDQGDLSPNQRVARIEGGLGRLAGHGALISVLSFPASTGVETVSVGSTEILAARVAGQLELADGAVVRFEARLVQDASSKRWALADLVIPGFLP